MAEKVEKFRITPEQNAWLYRYKGLRKGLEAVDKMVPRNATEAQFLQRLVQEIMNERQALMQALPKERVSELHDQPAPEDLDALRINY